MPLYGLPEHHQLDPEGRGQDARRRGNAPARADVAAVSKMEALQWSHLDNHYIPASKQRETPRPGLNWIGKSMKRVEDPRLLAGKGRYVDDVVQPNMAHAAVLRSPHAHARIKSIDVSKAEALPGVVLVMTGAQAFELTGPIASFASPPVVQYCMAVDRVRHVGEAVAAVVAEDRYVAEDALDLIEVEYELLPVTVDPEAAATATGKAVLHPDRGPTNCVFDNSFKFGTVDEDFAKADVVVKRRIKWGARGRNLLKHAERLPEFDEGQESTLPTQIQTSTRLSDLS